MYQLILLLHVLGATVWTGGHLVLVLTVLPKALRMEDPEILLDFESGYEKVAMPALFLQVLTGLWLAYRYLPDLSAWFAFDSILSTYVAAKLLLLVATFILAIDARLRIVPRLSRQNLKSFAAHIVAVTVLSVLFVVVGVGFRA
jgi:putative copper export protein